jgi:hypothetical protein
MKIAIFLLGAAAFAALQLSASALAGRTGLGSQSPVRCAGCGVSGFCVDGGVHRWHLLRVRTYHEGTNEAAVGCRHAWVDDPAGTGGIPCGALPALPLVHASFAMALVSLASLVWLILGLERGRAAGCRRRPA